MVQIGGQQSWYFMKTDHQTKRLITGEEANILLVFHDIGTGI